MKFFYKTSDLKDNHDSSFWSMYFWTVVAALSPADINYDETLSTLRYSCLISIVNENTVFPISHAIRPWLSYAVWVVYLSIKQ